MRKSALGFVAAIAAGTLVLTACGGGRGGEEATSESSASSEAGGGAEGFEAGATIGISLPWLGTQNWTEAQDIFTSELEDAGFKPLVQAADNKVTQQQQQIESMIEQGAKVIVVAPIDGTQLGSVLESAADAGVYIIGYDRLIENTEAVDAVVLPFVSEAIMVSLRCHSCRKISDDILN